MRRTEYHERTPPKSRATEKLISLLAYFQEEPDYMGGVLDREMLFQIMKWGLPSGIFEKNSQAEVLLAWETPEFRQKVLELKEFARRMILVGVAHEKVPEQDRKDLQNEIKEIMKGARIAAKWFGEGHNRMDVVPNFDELSKMPLRDRILHFSRFQLALTIQASLGEKEKGEVPNGQYFVGVCENCLKPFEKNRLDQKFDSNSCRTMNSRKNSQSGSKKGEVEEPL